MLKIQVEFSHLGNKMLRLCACLIISKAISLQ